MEPAEIEEKLRALRKKLTQIDQLKDKDPTHLDELAKAKVASEEGLKTEISRLEVLLKADGAPGPYPAAGLEKSGAAPQLTASRTPPPTVVAASPQMATAHQEIKPPGPAKNATSLAAEASQLDSTAPAGPSPEKEKRIKAPNKKITQIEQLKLKDPSTLDGEAQRKVASEVELRSEIAALERGEGPACQNISARAGKEAASTSPDVKLGSYAKDRHAEARAVELAFEPDNLNCDKKTLQEFKNLQTSLRAIEKIHGQDTLGKGQQGKLDKEPDVIAELAAMRAEFSGFPEPNDLEDLQSSAREAELVFVAGELGLERELQAEYKTLQKQLREIGTLYQKETLNRRDRDKLEGLLKKEAGIMQYLANIRGRSKLRKHKWDVGTIQDDWINNGRTFFYGTWENPFDSLGEEAAACLPPPKPDEWEWPTYDKWDGNNGWQDPRMKALQTGNLAHVRKLFTKPRDLLVWEIDGVDAYHEFSLEAAFESLNKEILEHLFNLSPTYFMQLLTMKQTHSYMKTNTPFEAALEVGGQHLRDPLRPDRSADCLSVVQWMCRNGIMTDTLFTDTPNISLIRYRTWGPQEHAPPPPDVAAELKRWNNLTQEEKRRLTEERFADLLGPSIKKIIVNVSLKNSVVECHNMSGDLLTSFDFGVTPDASTLVKQISIALGKDQNFICPLTPAGKELLKCDGGANLSTLLS